MAWGSTVDPYKEAHMSSPYDHQIEEMLAQYRKQREGVGETVNRVKGITGTATAQRQTVKVTADGQGQVTAIEFPTGAYRRLPPKELADVLLTTIQQARANAMEQIDDIASEQLPPGVTFSGLIKGEVDPMQMLKVDPTIPSSIWDPFDNGHPKGSTGGGRG